MGGAGTILTVSVWPWRLQWGSLENCILPWPGDPEIGVIICTIAAYWNFFNMLRWLLYVILDTLSHLVLPVTL